MDLCISFDTTGSMQPCVNEVRRKVQELSSLLFTTIPDLRIAIMAHGDYNDLYEIHTLEFTDNQKSIQQFIKDQTYATSGFGNGGELYEKVMHIAGTLEWKSDKRVFIMIGDEPAHVKGKQIGSYYSKAKVVEYDWLTEAQQLSQLGITSYIVRCLDRSDSKYFHTTLAQVWCTPLLHLHQFANIPELLTAIAFKNHSDERLEEYQTELESTFKLNRNIRDLIGSLLGNAPIQNIQATGLQRVNPTRFQVLEVDKEQDIKSFVLSSGATFKIGRGFYELTKPETVQEQKEVILQNDQGDFFTGSEAREKIGMPYGSKGKVRPWDVPKGYRAFIQSTSVNRKLLPKTYFLYEVDAI